ncbi:XRE family transcriptional regulator [Streptomyces sp. NBC_00820]|uniref:helix-turn-helix domain-containing protein n=1 Tax=Streptomyces sp. NBC_00820 TaxID=2975842 RepID=UPI002ED0A3B4|nr:XRE family transcriptional regulator [Streptomyces sp. NBC_00820]
MRHPRETATPDEALAASLRELKDRTGLSLAALAARTPYSKSAWHRYLTGCQRPPRPAVEALSRLAGADPAAVLARWEAADGPPPASPPGEAPGRRRAWARWVPLPALALLGVAAAVALPDRGGAPVTRVLTTVRHCHGRSCRGELPDASVCARGARTESSVTGAAYDVRLRYSPSCGTAWSEARTRAPRPLEVSVRAGQDALSASYPADGSGGGASPMLAVGSPRGVEACAEVAGELACTGLDVEPNGPE